MAGSSSGFSPHVFEAESSTRHLQDEGALFDDTDSDDPVANHAQEQELLADDPLEHEAREILSFKRKQKQPVRPILSSFLSPLGANRDHSKSPSPRLGTPRSNASRSPGLRRNIDGGSSNVGLDTNLNQSKDGTPLDWYIEGPGRRVGYEDMTAIDWIFEYTKERQRLRALYSNASGILGYVRRMLDASQIWVVLILTGLTTGLIAASIDIASDWLGDLKTGYCAAGDDSGRFYLSKHFCCWGYSEWSQCHDWVSWSTAMHVFSFGGKWIIEYLFFVLYSVSLSSACNNHRD
jgi:chloride channel 3/4/5